MLIHILRILLLGKRDGADAVCFQVRTYFLNCFRKMPTFMPLLESRMLIWKHRRFQWGESGTVYIYRSL